jgi:hypothetical protein
VGRLGEAELVDEDLRELRVVVLTRMNDNVVGSGEPSLQLRDDRGHLHEVRSCPDDVEESLLGHVGSDGQCEPNRIQARRLEIWGAA